MRLGAGAALLAMAGLSQEPDVLIRSNVRLVEIYATVRDGNGKPIARLQRSEFDIRDNGVGQKVIDFQADDMPLSCAILLDTTGSMSSVLPAVKNAAARLIDQLRPQDTVAVYTFSRALQRVQPFTREHESAKRALFGARATGQTAFFDAILTLVDDLVHASGKKAIVAFTDGADNSSVLRAPAAIRRASRAGLPIYIVAQGQALEHGDLLDQLAEIAQGTGGRLHRARSAGDIREVFAEIANDLQPMYFLSYKPPAGRAGSWRTVTVKVASHTDARIRAKRGYFVE